MRPIGDSPEDAVCFMCIKEDYVDSTSLVYIKVHGVWKYDRLTDEEMRQYHNHRIGHSICPRHLYELDMDIGRMGI